MMEINKIQLAYSFKSGFTSDSLNQIRHIKTLPYLSVVQATEGSYDIQLGNGAQYNTGDSGFFIAPAHIQQTITHNTDPVSKQIACRYVFLKVKINDLYDIDHLYDFPIIIPENYRSQMHQLFDRLFAADNLFDESVCYYEIVRLLYHLSQKKAKQIPPHLDKALTYIKDHYDSKITVDDIARSVNLSASHLYGIFKKQLGTSPITYLNHYRLSVAADALLQTNETIGKIANMVGIGDSVYFNKLFRKVYQMPPSQYRQTYKNREVTL